MSTVVVESLDGFTYGCDPEVFIVDANNKPVSAEGIIPGTKNKPFKVEKGAVQVDGMAAEFNIDPARTFEEFNTNITTVMKHLHGFLPDGHKFLFTPSLVFPEDVWDASPPKAKELGCNPDFNAWTGGVNPPPHNPDNPRLRTASGHLHIGWTENESLSNLQHIMNCRDLVKQLDYYLGLWSLRLDSDATRRSLYGKAGACRFKDYGVEYRVLSNFWLISKDRRRDVWNRMVTAINQMSSQFLPDYGEKYLVRGANELVIQSINESKRNSLLEKKFSFPVMNVL